MLAFEHAGVQSYCGDNRAILKGLPAGCVQTCVTSPPYFGLRDYGVDGQIGLETSPDEYVAALVDVFRQVWRVLADDGTLWLNLGDSYCSQGGPQVPQTANAARVGGSDTQNGGKSRTVIGGLKPKDLIGIPWRVAFALQSDGWYLRSDIIWSKPNPMPESVKDRPTKAHEYIFLLSKSERYFYDAAAIKEPAVADLRNKEGWAEAYSGNPPQGLRRRSSDKQRGHSRRHAGFNDRWDLMSKKEQCAMGRNKRSVWEVATHPCSEAHFATFPPELIRPCILAGSKQGDTVLDPFGGSGTTAMVAMQTGRRAILCELNTEYIEIQKRRLKVNQNVLFVA